MNQTNTNRLITELANALFVADKQVAVLVAQSRSDPQQWEPVHRSNAELYERAALYLKANPDPTLQSRIEQMPELLDMERIPPKKRK